MHKRATFEIASGKAFEAIQNEKQIPRDQLAAALEVDELEIPRICAGSDPLSVGVLLLFMKTYDVSFEDFHAKVLTMLEAAEAEVK